MLRPLPTPSASLLRGALAGLVAAALLAFAPGAASPAWAKLDSGAYRQILKDLDEGLRQEDDLAVARAIKALAEDDSDRAVKLVAKVVGRMWQSEAVYDALKHFVGALTDDRALKQMRRQAERARPWQAQLLFVDAIGEARGAREIETLAEAAKDKETKVALAACRQLGVMKTTASVEALIGVMQHWEDKGDQGIAWEDARNALTRALGVKLDMGIDYRNYLDARRDQFVEGSGLTGGDGDGGDPYAGGGLGGDSGTVTMFGEPIRCKKVVIILDRSGSMVLKDPYPKGHKRAGAGTAAREGGGEDEHAWIKDPERERMFRAKQELKKVLEGLSNARDTAVNLIAYSSDVTFWREEGLHEPKGKDLDDMKTWIDALEPEGVTVTDTAIAYAFERIPEADCFYVISDGMATHDGTSKVPTPQILDMIADMNRLKKVQVHTFGFAAHSGNPKDGADPELMNGIAELTGGRYSEIK